MTRAELRDLMQFVTESNSRIIVEALRANNIETSGEQSRAILMAVEERTKQCFFRFMEKADK